MQFLQEEGLYEAIKKLRPKTQSYFRHVSLARFCWRPKSKTPQESLGLGHDACYATVTAGNFIAMWSATPPPSKKTLVEMVFIRGANL